MLLSQEMLRHAKPLEHRSVVDAEAEAIALSELQTINYDEESRMLELQLAQVLSS